jgi:hypothetical protein
MTYKIQTTARIGGNQTSIILLNADGSYTTFPNEVDGPEYQAYLAWLAEGNTPEPADSTP